MALAGGVYASMTQDALIALSEIEMLSASGYCRAFDAEADGMVLSEGVGMVVLKRLEDAERDGDPIHGVICASGLNQDGASNGSPRRAAPRRRIDRPCLRPFRDRPRGYSLCRGAWTGTRLGDPIEANALTRAFRRFTTRTHYCALGSAKAHIGHCAAGAAVIGLIKVLLSLKHRTLPGLPNFRTLNSKIEFENATFFIATQTREWPRSAGKPAMAALNSFGHSGTNVHLVIRSICRPLRTCRASRTAPATSSCPCPRESRSPDRGRRALRDFIDRHGEDARLADIACTLQTGREPMSCRLALVVSSLGELRQKLTAYIETGVVPEPSSLHEDADRVAASWTSGPSVDWSRHGGASASRIHLPAYPFARERYWAPAPASVTPAPQLAAIAPDAPTGATTYLLACPEWRESPPPRPEETSRAERVTIVCSKATSDWRSASGLIHLDEDDYASVALSVFEHLRGRLKQHARTRTLVQLVVPAGDTGSLLSD